MNEQKIERVARAICESVGYNADHASLYDKPVPIPGTKKTRPLKAWEHFRRHAMGAINAMEKEKI